MTPRPGDARRLLSDMLEVRRRLSADPMDALMVLNLFLPDVKLLAAADPNPGDPPVLDEGRFEVLWRGKRCRIGNRIRYWLFEKLLKNAGRCVTTEELIRAGWRDRNGNGSDERLWEEVSRLRRRLGAAGMEDLASAIDGTSEPRHYRLDPIWLLEDRD